MRKRIAVIGLVVLALVATLVPTFAQTFRYPTWEYYGQILDVDAFLARVDEGLFTACTPKPSLERHLDERSPNIDYICFDTQAEVDAHIAAVINPEYARLNALYPDVERAVPAEYAG